MHKVQVHVYVCKIDVTSGNHMVTTCTTHVHLCYRLTEGLLIH